VGEQRANTGLLSDQKAAPDRILQQPCTQALAIPCRMRSGAASVSIWPTARLKSPTTCSSRHVTTVLAEALPRGLEGMARRPSRAERETEGKGLAAIGECSEAGVEPGLGAVSVSTMDVRRRALPSHIPCRPLQIE
jgi:hypothetical protein